MMNQALIRTSTNESTDPASPGSVDKLLMLNVVAKTQGRAYRSPKTLRYFRNAIAVAPFNAA